MKRLFATAMLATAITACGAVVHPGDPAAEGTVTGQVLAYPCAPVERAGEPCPGRPAVATVRLAPQSGGTTESVTTGTDGRYRIEVAAGRYVVTVSGRPLGSASRTVDVGAGATVTVDFVIDSGIR